MRHIFLPCFIEMYSDFFAFMFFRSYFILVISYVFLFPSDIGSIWYYRWYFLSILLDELHFFEFLMQSLSLSLNWMMRLSKNTSWENDVGVLWILFLAITLSVVIYEEVKSVLLNLLWTNPSKPRVILNIVIILL